MEIQKILARCDHTLLRQDCRSEEISLLCDQAIRFGCASVCIPPIHEAGAKRYVGPRMGVCTVIGFPNGYATSAVKAFEAADAVRQGADEVDMVVNLCMVKDRCWGDVLADITAVRNAVPGRILKVIVEACLLSEWEKTELCRVVSDSGADFIKTSTGFSSGGATAADVALMRRVCAQHVRVKAAGGISSFEFARQLLEAGADRLGASRLVKIAEEMESSESEDCKADGQNGDE